MSISSNAFQTTIPKSPVDKLLVFHFAKSSLPDQSSFFFLLNNIFYIYCSLWQFHKVTICWCDRRWFVVGHHHFCWFWYIFFTNIVSKVLDHLNVLIHFFNMLRTKCDKYIYSYLGWSWPGKNITFFSWSQRKY